jgi:Phage integrase, N-terminal SAM-like domain
MGEKLILRALAAEPVCRGVHTARNRSITVAEAGKLWLEAAENNKLERATRDHYRQHLMLHILPHFGSTKLSDLTPAAVSAFPSTDEKPTYRRSGRTSFRRMSKN